MSGNFSIQDAGFNIGVNVQLTKRNITNNATISSKSSYRLISNLEKGTTTTPSDYNYSSNMYML